LFSASFSLFSPDGRPIDAVNAAFDACINKRRIIFVPCQRMPAAPPGDRTTCSSRRMGKKPRPRLSPPKNRFAFSGEAAADRQVPVLESGVPGKIFSLILSASDFHDLGDPSQAETRTRHSDPRQRRSPSLFILSVGTGIWASAVDEKRSHCSLRQA
jgi:hypothetical protein